MDNTTKYAIFIVLVIITVAGLIYLRRGTSTTSSPATNPQNLSLTPTADQYVIEGFPLDNHITFFGPNNTLKDIGYMANDAGESEWDIWSAARILTEINNITPYNVNDSSPPSSDVLWSSEKIATAIATGNSSGVLIDDNSTSSIQTWSSQNIDSNIKNLINDTQTSSIQTWSSQQISDSLAALPVTTGSSEINDAAISSNSTWSSTKIDSSIRAVPQIDDSSTSAGSIWSSQKTNSMLLNTLQPIAAATAGDIPIITNTGGLIDSGYRIDDTVTGINTLWSSVATDNALSNKISLVPGSNINEIAVFDGSGGISKSNLSVQDNAPSNSNVLWSSTKTDLLLGGKQNVVSNAAAGNISFFDASGQVVDKAVRIDDNSSASPAVLWSSQKTENVLSQNQRLVPGAKINHLASFDGNGQILDSGTVVDDGSLSTSVLWSSSKILEQSNTKQNLAANASPGNLAMFDSVGQVTDAMFSVKDSAPATNALWSSSFTNAKLGEKQNIVQSAIAGNIASFDSSGQVVDTNAVFNDSLPAANNVLWSSQKITAAQNQMQTLSVPSSAGNLASLNASGQITDSTYSVNDSSGPKPNIVWSSEKITSTVSTLPYQKLGTGSSGNFLIYDSTGQSTESNFKIDDSTSSPTSLWSSEKVTSNFQQKIVPSATGNIATLDGTGQISDSGFSVSDASAANSNIIWSSAKTESISNNKQNFIQNPSSGRFVSTDNTGQTVMTQYAVDDTAVGSSVLWSSQKIASGVPSGAPGNVTVLASQGSGVTDSGIKIDDAAPAAPNVLWTSQKISQTSSQSSSIDDTTISPSSTWSSQQSANAIQNMANTKMDKVPSAPVQSIARFSTGGQVESSGFVLDDSAVSASALWSSLKTDATYQKLVTGVTNGIIPIFSSAGQVTDSGFKFDDTVVSSKTIKSSQNIFDNYVGRKTGIINAGQYILFEGVRFGLSNPQGLTLQMDSASAPLTSAWIYGTGLMLPNTYATRGSQFYIPGPTSAPAACVPIWSWPDASNIEFIIRLDSKKMYRVTVNVNVSWINCYVIIEKLM